MNHRELPEGYALIRSIDLQKDKKLALAVNLGALIILAAMFVLAVIARGGLSFTFDGVIFGKGLFILAGTVAYIVLHELTHGVVMRALCDVKPKYGFTGMYAYAGSAACYDKRSYIMIAMAPIVIWGVVLAVLTLVLPEGWFWPVYIIQMLNISGAAGDLYVTRLISAMPADTLVRDSGYSMDFYSRQGNAISR